MGIVKFKIILAGFPAVMSVCTCLFATMYPLFFPHNKTFLTWLIIIERITGFNPFFLSFLFLCSLVPAQEFFPDFLYIITISRLPDSF